MAPKAKSKTKPSKSEVAKKSKVAEDITFGLKNKNKSKKVQAFVKQVQHQVTNNNSKGGATSEFQAQQQAKNEKKAKAQQALLMASLFKGMDNTKSKAADKGGPTIEEMKEAQKIDLYVDPRGSSQKNEMCKAFLEACEATRYGWFWNCPNGKDCIYKHALDEGYILKKDRPKPGEDKEFDEENLAIVIDAELKAMDKADKGTPVTAETFKAWKAKMDAERKIELTKLLEEDKKKSKKKAKDKEDTNEKSAVSGKDLFDIKPELFIDDVSAMRGDGYQEDEAYLDELRKEEEDAQKDHERLQRELLEAVNAEVDESLFATNEENDNLDSLDDVDLDE